ncbi:flagellar basal body rod protein FlgB [Undibacterium sp. FT79W]|uniref:Flagellar basal body rod protein FlgB n=1 Tax=Undibacterium rivi TaxID=2828729 RepID=A0ABS5H1B5_9BURK|nr:MULTISPECIES: flagellar basal body rod protein FlgB [Undibacterium]MBC3877085.1 flagellar basal body rod protein FlgB [Undibacterium sp. FT79W]MBK1891496.1 flagellar basal body rod protein FlgB [Undibacterium sp. 14-3-2]MBR7792505.1 flagellar basal body rod protein FlgB [Undibacterium rivi]
MTKLDDFMRFHETALSVRGQRQQLLASNIANADTPNYKARDIDFTSVLNNALHLDSKQATASLNKTDAQHLGSASTVAGAEPMYRTVSQGNIDGNTVDMDVERNQFAENSLRYEASLTIINMQIRNMLAAIQG